MSKKIKIYTVDYCPFCQKAKLFFAEQNQVFEEIYCEDDEENYRKKLTEKYGLNSLATFPQIEIDGVHIGGYSDLIDKYSNKEIIF